MIVRPQAISCDWAVNQIRILTTSHPGGAQVNCIAHGDTDTHTPQAAQTQTFNKRYALTATLTAQVPGAARRGKRPVLWLRVCFEKCGEAAMLPMRTLL